MSWSRFQADLSALLLLTVAVGAKEQLMPCAVFYTIFKSSDCSPGERRNVSAISFGEECQFIEDGLYRATCSVTSIILEPCFADSLTVTKTYPLNTCLAEPLWGKHSLVFEGDCSEAVVCPAPSSPMASHTAAPTPNRVIARAVLPSPPLPPNDFADQILDVNTAHETAYLAGKLIYRMTNSTDAAALLPDKFTLHLYEDTGSTEVMIITSTTESTEPSKIMVVFRGTDDSPDGDWLTNINLSKVAFGPDSAKLEATVVARDFWGVNTTYELRVHKGFNGVFSENLYEKVLSKLQPLHERRVDGNGAPYYGNAVYFMGHSLGGANAQLFGTYYAFFHPHISTHVTTLGAPRQGNFAYKVLVESLPNLSVWRMVNCRDVVPRVPNVRYYHAGHLMWKRCGNGNNASSPGQTDVVEAYYRQAGDLEQGYSDVPLNWVSRYDEQTMISDHMGGAYMEWLEYAKHEGQQNWTTDFERLLPPSVHEAAPDTAVDEAALYDASSSATFQALSRNAVDIFALVAAFWWAC